MLDDRRRQCVLGPEVEVQGTLRDVGGREDVVKVDLAVWLGREPVRGSLQKLQPRDVSLFSHREASPTSGRWLFISGLSDHRLPLGGGSTPSFSTVLRGASGLWLSALLGFG